MRFPLEITVSVDRETQSVVVAFGPMDAGDVAHLIDHIAHHHESFRETLVDHVADAVMQSQDTVT